MVAATNARSSPRGHGSAHACTTLEPNPQKIADVLAAIGRPTTAVGATPVTAELMDRIQRA
eukprot:1349828-Prymnesium_polylepis.1